MSSSPLVSVIIPCRNGAAWLGNKPPDRSAWIRRWCKILEHARERAA